MYKRFSKALYDFNRFLQLSPIKKGTLHFIAELNFFFLLSTKSKMMDMKLKKRNKRQLKFSLF